MGETVDRPVALSDVGRTTADAFVHGAAPATFPTPLRPTVTVGESVDMAAVG